MLEYIIIALSCIAIGWHLREIVAIRKIHKMLQQAAVEQEKDDYTHIKIEKHSDMYYVFEVDTDKFLCQGSTSQELIETLKKLYPTKTFKAFVEDVPEGFEQ